MLRRARLEVLVAADAAAVGRDGPGPRLALTTEELKYADIRNIGARIAPLHFLEVKLDKRPQPVKSDLEELEELRKGLQGKTKVAAARCWNKKKEQRESERLELMNAELKSQI
ncbi:hypothetical protein QTO34_008465 [Cnephaeus nilssonii]|uniref:Uncharacterized protein n=1 Tax=Cnephaeus nilssonii TaxID=3371016 RepID=A0AA40IAC8_CNENI|nr:hypothetical protein QTO34_008465 [Eptesicus nilssonii]